MPTVKKHRCSSVVSVGCGGWRKSTNFFNGKQRLHSPKPIEYEPPTDEPNSSPSATTTKHSPCTSDDLRLSFSSRDSFALTTKSFSDELSATSGSPDEDDLPRQLDDLQRSLLEWMSSSTLSPPPPKRVEFVGGLGRSLVVVKLSDDPLVDFRSSMLQMVVEKEIVTVDGLRELLRCYFSLNSPQHHPLIIRAFFEIWTDSFPRTPEKFRRTRRGERVHFSGSRRYLL